MTPKEVYIICTKIVKRKKELENENKPIEKIIEILKQEFSDLFEKKPFLHFCKIEIFQIYKYSTI